MSDLDDALRALREEHDGKSDAAPATRRKLLLAASTRRRRRVVFLKLAWPIAAVLAVSTAWAAGSGRLTRWVDALRTDEHAEHVEAPPPAHTLPPPSTSAPPPSVVASEEEPPPPAPSASSAKVAPAPPKIVDRDAALDAEDGLYREAHEAHFTKKDPQAALVAWDAYLAKYPNGRFAPEAKYNRALSLVRLGRNDEAKQALRPFAEGKYGGYRQRDAEKLLGALE